MKNIKKIYCLCCEKYRNCKCCTEVVTENIDNISITYLKRKYVCLVCGNEVSDNETFDYNIFTSNDELRKKTGLIRTCEIKEILEKYNISSEDLSLMLGFKFDEITRKLKSGNPSKELSDKLKSIKDNPYLFKKYLDKYME